MIPKIHAKGSSFKGAAAYLLHDKGRAQTAERVTWVETRNLATGDAEIGWRIMAATAMDQDRLKENAGVKSTGRKSDKHVLHLTLAWHPEQQPSRAEMSAAADGALAALGARDRQALVIAHDDEAHSHLHVLINRVSPEDGRHLSSSNERRNLSRWAEQYEKDGGKVYCEAREVNNALRSDGEYVRGEKNQPRHLFEQQRAAASNDNRYLEAMRAGQTAKDAVIALQGRQQAERHTAAQLRLEDAHKARLASIKTETARSLAVTRRELVATYKPRLAEMLRRQRAELAAHDTLERTLFGRVRNTRDALALIKRVHGEERGSIIARGFRVLASAGARREAFKAAHARERAAIKKEQAAELKAAQARIKSDEVSKLAKARTSFQAERSALVFSQDMDRAKLRSAWRQRSKDRAAAWEKFAALEVRRRQARGGFAGVVSPDGKVEAGYRASRLAQHARLAMGRDAAENPTKKDKDRGDRER